jgi:UDP:flavonoid glycosyltransferase YjiC (YdhE family)
VRVLFGVCSEGWGHVERSRLLAAELIRRGAQVTFATGGGDKVAVLGRLARTVIVPQPILAYRDGSVDVTSTVGGFASFLLSAGPAIRRLSRLEFDAVVSDFEPLTLRAANLRGKPSIRVDNMAILPWGEHEFRADNALDLAAVKLVEMMGRPTLALIPSLASCAIVPGAMAHLCTPTVKRFPVTIARDHWTAYFSDLSPSELHALSETPTPVYLFGTRNEPGSSVGSVRFLDRKDFETTLASSRAAIGRAGFGFMTEVISLGKPLMVVPFQNQVEQRANAVMARNRGLCIASERVTPEAIDRLSEFAMSGARVTLPRVGEDHANALAETVTRC